MYKLTTSTFKQVPVGTDFYVCIDNAILFKYRKLRHNKACSLEEYIQRETHHVDDKQEVYVK